VRVYSASRLLKPKCWYYLLSSTPMSIYSLELFVGKIPTAGTPDLSWGCRIFLLESHKKISLCDRVSYDITFLVATKKFVGA
jgi:hypothetical protein